MARVKPGRSRHQGRTRVESGTAPNPYFSKAIQKAFQILEMLKQDGEPLSLSQMTARLGLAKSSTFRILRTLEQIGYVKRTSGDDYALSPAVSSLVPNRKLMHLIEIAGPFMQELGREFRECVSLGFLFENFLQLPAHEQIEFLVGPAEFNVGLEMNRVIALQQRINKFQEADLFFVFKTFLEIRTGQHLGHR